MFHVKHYLVFGQDEKGMFHVKPNIEIKKTIGYTVIE